MDLAKPADLIEWTDDPDAVIASGDAVALVDCRLPRDASRERRLAPYDPSRQAAALPLRRHDAARSRKAEWQAAGNGSNADHGIGIRRRARRGFRIKTPQRQELKMPVRTSVTRSDDTRDPLDEIAVERGSAIAESALALPAPEVSVHRSAGRGEAALAVRVDDADKPAAHHVFSGPPPPDTADPVARLRR